MTICTNMTMEYDRNNKERKKIAMISYKPFWNTLKKKNITTYTLIKEGISSATINRLRHNQGISTQTIDDLCQLLDCRAEDIIEIIPNKMD